MDYNSPGSSVHGTRQARILEWVDIPPPEDLPHPGIKPASLTSPPLHWQMGSLPLSATWEAHSWTYTLIKAQFRKKIHAMPMSTEALFTIARAQRQPICLSTEEWMHA